MPTQREPLDLGHRHPSRGKGCEGGSSEWVDPREGHPALNQSQRYPPRSHIHQHHQPRRFDTEENDNRNKFQQQQHQQVRPPSRDQSASPVRKSLRQEERRERGSYQQQQQQASVERHEMEFSPPPSRMTMVRGKGSGVPSLSAMNGQHMKGAPSSLRGDRVTPVEDGHGEYNMMDVRGGRHHQSSGKSSIVADLEREAASGSGRDKKANAPSLSSTAPAQSPPSGLSGNVDDMDLAIMTAPSFADRPPTPSPPRLLTSMENVGAEEGIVDDGGPKSQSLSPEEAMARVEKTQVPERDNRGRCGGASPCSLSESRALPPRIRNRDGGALQQTQQQPPRLPPSPQSHRLGGGGQVGDLSSSSSPSRPYPQSQQHARGSHLGHPSQQYPPQSSYGYHSEQHQQGRYPPPQHQHTGPYGEQGPYSHQGPHPPLQGHHLSQYAYYSSGEYGPPPPRQQSSNQSTPFGYPRSHPAQNQRVVDRWPEDTYPRRRESSHQRGERASSRSPLRGGGRDSSMGRRGNHIGGGRDREGFARAPANEGEGGHDGGVGAEVITPRNRSDFSPSLTSPLSKKRRMAVASTPRTAATAASTPPESGQDQLKRGDSDSAQTLLAVASPYTPSSRKREGGGPNNHNHPERSPEASQRSPTPLPHTPGAGALGRAPTFTMDTPGGSGPGHLDPARLDEIFPSLDPSASFGIEGAPFPMDDPEDGPDGGDGQMNLGLMRSGSTGDALFVGTSSHASPQGQELRSGSVMDGSMGPDRGMTLGSSVRQPSRTMFRQRRDGGSGGGLRGGGGVPDDDMVQASPFTSFMGELSPLQSNHHGTPLAHRRDSFGREQYTDTAYGPERNRGHSLPIPIPSLSARGDRATAHRGMAPHQRLRASPMSARSDRRHHPQTRGTQPLYRDDRTHPSPGPFRLQLGGIGIEQTEARRGMEGINSALKGRPQLPTSSGEEPRGLSPHGYRSGRHCGYDYQGDVDPGGVVPPSSIYRNDYRTPIKAGGAPSSVTGSAARVPTSGAPTPSAPGSTNKSQYAGFPGTTPLKTPAAAAAAMAAASSGKENETPKRRHPCNCKKSKCLKLYCECFAAELYCEGCNCQDCSNTNEYEAVRSKAIRDTKAKNPNAFKSRFAVKDRGGGGVVVNTGGAVGSPLPLAAHNMGCRCKKSACLKKYCECFEAGVMCGSKCKCADCLNYVGSQALIDRRRKIKDHRGAELAMKSADEAWKAGQHSGQKQPPLSRSGGMGNAETLSAATSGGVPPHAAYPTPTGAHHSVPVSHMGGPGSHMQAPGQYPHHPHMSMPPMMHPSPSQHHPGSMPPGYHGMPPHMMMGHHHPPPGPPTMGYSPMAVQPTPPAYSGHRRRDPQSVGGRSVARGSGRSVHSAPQSGGKGRRGGGSELKQRSASKVGSRNDLSPYSVPPATPVAASGTSSILKPMSDETPQRAPHRTPSRRLDFDPLGSKRKRKIQRGFNEPAREFFGPSLPAQTKTAALSVFSFLSNDDIYNTSLVCKGWSKLSLDEELWHF